MRSDSVVFPWSMWATIEKLRMKSWIGHAANGDPYRRSVDGWHRLRLAGSTAAALVRRSRARGFLASRILAPDRAGPVRPRASATEPGRPRPVPALPVPQEPRPRDHGGVVRRIRPLGQVDRDSMLVSPGRERRAQLRVGGDAAGEGERADSLRGVDFVHPGDERRHDGALEGREQVHELAVLRSTTSVSASSGEPSIRRRWSSRSIAVFKPENEKSREPSTRPTGKREAVAASLRRDAIDDGPARITEAGAPGNLVEGFAGGVVPGARNRDDRHAIGFHAHELRVAARDDEAVEAGRNRERRLALRLQEGRRRGGPRDGSRPRAGCRAPRRAPCPPRDRRATPRSTRGPPSPRPDRRRRGGRPPPRAPARGAAGGSRDVPARPPRERLRRNARGPRAAKR